MGSSTVVSNSSPLICLAKAGHLDTVRSLFGQLCVPEAVRREIEAGPADDPMRVALPEAEWIEVVEVRPPLSPLIPWRLGASEAEVLEYARTRLPATVLLDDGLGRRLATKLGLVPMGTLGVLARAHQVGHVSDLRAAIEDVRGAGLWVSGELVESILAGLDVPG